MAAHRYCALRGCGPGRRRSSPQLLLRLSAVRRGDGRADPQPSLAPVGALGAAGGIVRESPRWPRLPRAPVLKRTWVGSVSVGADGALLWPHVRLRASEITSAAFQLPPRETR